MAPEPSLPYGGFPGGHLPAAHEELLQVFVSEVTQHPLAPDHVVRLGDEVEVLQARAEEAPHLQESKRAGEQRSAEKSRRARGRESKRS